MKAIKHFSKKYFIFLAATALGFFLVPDVATLATTLFRISMAAFVSLLWLLIIGHGKGWGIFTELDIAELYEKATDTTAGPAAVGSAIILLALVMLICVTIISVLF